MGTHTFKAFRFSWRSVTIEERSDGWAVLRRHLGTMSLIEARGLTRFAALMLAGRIAKARTRDRLARSGY